MQTCAATTSNGSPCVPRHLPPLTLQDGGQTCHVGCHIGRSAGKEERADATFCTPENGRGETSSRMNFRPVLPSAAPSSAGAVLIFHPTSIRQILLTSPRCVEVCGDPVFQTKGSHFRDCKVLSPHHQNTIRPSGQRVHTDAVSTGQRQSVGRECQIRQHLC